MMPIVRITLPAEKRALREKMRALGLGHRQIAAEFARRYRLRPRAAWREAHGWSLREAAAQINAYTGAVGLDPGGISSMTAPHLCEHENWPGPGPQPSGRRPSPYLLALLACVYGCTAGDLIDLADREQLPPAELLILDTYGQEIPNLRNEDRPSQLPRPPAQPAPQQPLSAVPAITYCRACAGPSPAPSPDCTARKPANAGNRSGSGHITRQPRPTRPSASTSTLRPPQADPGYLQNWRTGSAAVIAGALAWIAAGHCPCASSPPCSGLSAAGPGTGYSGRQVSLLRVANETVG